MTKKVIKISHKFPLTVILMAPFVLQIIAATSLVGYLSFRNGQKAVNDLANQLMVKTDRLVEQHLDTYLALPHQINQINADAIRLGQIDLHDSESAGHYFWKQMQVFNVSYIGGALSTGDFAGAGSWLEGQGVTIDERSARTSDKDYTFATDDQGNRQKVVRVDNFDPRAEDWYTTAVAARKPLWSAVYNWDETPEFVSIDASYPIYDNKQQIIAVLDVAFLLTQISHFLRELAVSPSGNVFVIERDGALIASSGTEQPFTLVDGKAERLSALNSSEPAIQAAARYLKNWLGDFKKIEDQESLDFQFNHERQFVYVNPWQDKFGLDWLVVVVVPESDFMGQINANTRITIALCLAALIITILLGLATARWIIQPVLRLNQAAKAIAAGDFEQTVIVERQDELGELAQSFNQMAAQLKTSFGAMNSLNNALTTSQLKLAISNQTLERQVKERTQELSKTLEQLQTAQTEIVHSEKMAALGQLVAGIAHEINTPLGAIQASIGNIANALDRSLQALPPLMQTLAPERLHAFLMLLGWTKQPKELLSSREERQLKRTLRQALTEQGISNADILADTLSKMGVNNPLDPIFPLLRAPDAPSVLDTAYHLSAIQNNSQNIRLAVERASRIVYALKHYVRQDISDEPVSASIVEGINTVLTLYQNQLKRGIEVTKTYAAVPLLRCYPEELVQVWSNLVSNALHSMSYQGRLDIAISQQDQHVVVQITDSGSGIPTAIKDKIFEPFFTTKPVGEGSGLGLSIVRKIVHKHHGRIEVESEPGHTVFQVWLPLDFQRVEDNA